MKYVVYEYETRYHEGEVVFRLEDKEYEFVKNNNVLIPGAPGIRFCVDGYLGKHCDLEVDCNYFQLLNDDEVEELKTSRFSPKILDFWDFVDSDDF
jgi:hypothetical protein